MDSTAGLNSGQLSGRDIPIVEVLRLSMKSRLPYFEDGTLVGFPLLDLLVIYRERF